MVGGEKPKKPTNQPWGSFKYSENIAGFSYQNMYEKMALLNMTTWPTFHPLYFSWYTAHVYGWIKHLVFGLSFIWRGSQMRIEIQASRDSACSVDTEVRATRHWARMTDPRVNQPPQVTPGRYPVLSPLGWHVWLLRKPGALKIQAPI